MRLRTSGCSANNRRLLNRGPGVIPCPKLYLNVIFLLKILSLSVYQDGREHVGGEGEQR